MANFIYFPKDFLETPEGLLFAVVQAAKSSDNRVLVFLRYVKQDQKWHKLNTYAANTYLKQYHPDYLYYSSQLDAQVHAVPVDRIAKHHQPKQRLQELLAEANLDVVSQDTKDLCAYLQAEGVDLTQVGITGSILIKLQKESSDIDLVLYDRTQFHLARQALPNLIRQNKLAALDEQAWQNAYVRRNCALAFEEYVWHERRKANKGLINGRKFDLNLVEINPTDLNMVYQKQGPAVITGRVSDDRYAFDYPALYSIDHATIKTVVCFTATYVGQAFNGECIEASGLIEQTNQGELRLVVGSSREAPGEYIKVSACLN